MIEKTIVDRVPNNPGRVILSPVAGMENTFDMKRADGPIVEGTPIDKATLDSIIKSRLTGRYYQLGVSREVQNSASGATDPVPTSGWIENSYTDFDNGSYKLTSSYPNYPNLAVNAFDNSSTTYWAAESDSGETWIAIDFGVRIVVNKLSVCWFSYDYDYLEVSFQGSNDGALWTEIASTTGNRETPSDWSFANTVEYSMYRLVFTQGTENAMRLYDWSIVGWSANTYKNLYVAEGLPTEWTEGQRILVETPVSVNNVGVYTNLLNGVKIETLLLPNRLYELVYRGSSFTAKEV